MSWVLPTPAEVKAAYATLADIPDASVDAVLPLVGESIPKDLPSQIIYTEAAILYAAHELTLRGFGTGAEADLARSGSTNMQSVSDGAVSFSQKSQAAGDDGSAMSVTSFGRRYSALIAKHVIPILVISDNRK